MCFWDMKVGFLLILWIASCTGPAEKSVNPAIFLFLSPSSTIADPGPAGANLAKVQFDGLPVGTYPVTSCDVNNSSGNGIKVDGSAVFGFRITIGAVPVSSPYTFAANDPNLDLPINPYTTGVHIPDGVVACTLTRTINTSMRYSSSLSSGCTLNGAHTIQQLDIDCKPD